MSRVGRDTRQIALAEAFSEMGQAWIRWGTRQRSR